MEPSRGLVREHISFAPRLLVRNTTPRKNRLCGCRPKSNAFVQNSEKKIPQSILCLFDFVEQHETDLHLIGVVLVQVLLRNQRVSFTVSEISGRRAYQLCDLMTVLH